MAPPEITLTKAPDPAASQPELAFTATIEVRPEIVIPNLSSVAVSVPDIELRDQDVSQALEGLRERFGTLKTVERPAVDGDFVTLDLLAEKDGQEIDSISGVSYQIGSGRLLEGIDEALVGLSAGETTTFESALGGGEHAGQLALVTVTPKAIKERELPPLDDDFAQEASEFDTLEELKGAIGKGLTSQLENQQVAAASAAMIRQLLDTLDFPAPEGVVRADAESQLERSGKQDDPAALEDAIADATANIRTQLLMDAMVEHFGTKASSEELTRFMFETAEQYGVEPGGFIQGAERQGELPHFYAEVVRRKAAVKALRQVKVSTTSGQVIDMAARLGPEVAEPSDVSGEVRVPDGAGMAEDLTAAVDHHNVDQVEIALEVDQEHS